MSIFGLRFTTRGIIALVFSILAAILGLVVIVLYGMAEPVVPRPGVIVEAAKGE